MSLKLDPQSCHKRDLGLSIQIFAQDSSNRARPVARIDFEECGTPKKWTFWTHKARGAHSHT